MRNNWQEQPLSNLCTYLSRGVAPVYIDTGGTLVLNQKCIRDQRVNFTLARRTDPQKKSIATDRILQPKDILINSTGTGTLGRVAQVNALPETSTIDSHVTLVRPNIKVVDPLYLGLALRYFEPAIEALGEGSTGQTELSRIRLATFRIPMPISMREQKAVAHILSTLDDQIELNRCMNETLEAMAQALFKDWFVDFGPVRAKMEGRPSYLSENIWRLFPAYLDNEEKPQYWEEKALGEDFVLTMGQSPPGESYNDVGNGLPFFQGRTDFGFRYPKRRKYCTDPTRLAMEDDTLVSVRAPVGDINLAWEKCCIGRGLAAIHHKSGSRSFTYGTLHAIQDQLKVYECTGTVFGAINKKQFEDLRFIDPGSQLIEAFENITNPLDNAIRANTTESEVLVQLRDMLLPKLISGQIRIKDAEKILGDAYEFKI